MKLIINTNSDIISWVNYKFMTLSIDDMPYYTITIDSYNTIKLFDHSDNIKLDEG